MRTKLETGNDPHTADAALTATELASVRRILREELDVAQDQILPGADLTTDLGADSLTRVEIVMRLEEEFSVTLEDDIVEHVKTVGDVYAVVAKVLGR
jgi:acyl carrier protein